MQKDSHALGGALDRPYLSANDLRRGSEGFLHLVPDGCEMLVPPILPQSSFTTKWLWQLTQLAQYLTHRSNTSNDISKPMNETLAPEACEWCTELITGCLGHLINASQFPPLKPWSAVLKGLSGAKMITNRCKQHGPWGYRRPCLRAIR